MNDIEAEVAALTKGLDDLGEIDLDAVDLTLPPAYELRLMAMQRLGAVRDAMAMKVNAAANKLLNPAQAAEMTRQLNTCLLKIGTIDRKWPEAKAMSQQMAAVIAAEETRAEAERMKA